MALIISIAAILLGCGAGKQEVDVRVDLTGDPTPIDLAVDAGKCSAIAWRMPNEPSAYRCTVPQGKRTFTAHCGNSHPEAVLVIEARRGRSNAAQFRGVCSLSTRRFGSPKRQPTGS